MPMSWYESSDNRYFNPDDGKPDNNWDYNGEWPDNVLDVMYKGKDEELGSDSSTEPESDEKENHKWWKE